MRTRNHGVRGGHGGDDVLDDALREAVCHAVDVELGRAPAGLFKEELDVLRVVLVERLIFAARGVSVRMPHRSPGRRTFVDLLPADDRRPFDAVLGEARFAGNGAERVGDLRREELERAFDARAVAWDDDARLALET